MEFLDYNGRRSEAAKFAWRFKSVCCFDYIAEIFEGRVCCLFQLCTIRRLEADSFNDEVKHCFAWKGHLAMKKTMMSWYMRCVNTLSAARITSILFRKWKLCLLGFFCSCKSVYVLLLQRPELKLWYAYRYEMESQQLCKKLTSDERG